MSISNINKLLKKALKEIELEVLVDYPEITPEEMEDILAKSKLKILEDNGITPEEFLEYEESLKEIGREKGKKKKEERQKELDALEEKIVAQIPPEKELPPPQIITNTVNKVVKQVVREVIKEKPIHTTTFVEKLNTEPINALQSDIKELQSSFTDLYSRFDKIVIPTDYVPQSVLEPSIKEYIEPELNRILRSLQSQIYASNHELKGLISNENIWDRSGTTISQHTAGDNVNLGTGSLSLNNLTMSGYINGSSISANFIGTDAGSGATYAYYSNFMGWNAGKDAINANLSDFIGSFAGYGAGNAYYSEFIGTGAGYGQTNASHCIFIGSSAGNNNNQTSKTDFQNNLIIDQSILSTGGTRTTAAAIRTNALLYGTFADAAKNQQLTINAAILNLNAGVDTDLVVNFTGTTNSGSLTWMEDEDYFSFSDEIRATRIVGNVASNTTNILTPIVFNFDGTGQLTASSGTQRFGAINPIINQSGTAGYEALCINATEIGTGSGAKQLLCLMKNSAEVASVDSTGIGTFYSVTETTPTLLKLDQSTPQTVDGGIATFHDGLYVGTGTPSSTYGTLQSTSSTGGYLFAGFDPLSTNQLFTIANNDPATATASIIFGLDADGGAQMAGPESGAYLWTFGGGPLILQQYSSQGIYFWQGGNPGGRYDMQIAPSGNVLIGTVSDNSIKLQVETDAQYGPVAYFKNTNYEGWSAAVFYDYTGSEKASFGYGNPGTPVLAGTAFFNNQADFVINNNNIETMRTTMANNVLIGQTYDDGLRKLQLTGSSAYYAPYQYGDVVAYMMSNDVVSVYQNSDPTSLMAYGINQGAGYAYFQSYNINGGTTLPLAFFVDSTRVMDLSTGGNVLIGTTSDEGELLQVKGDIRVDDTGNYSFTPVFGVPAANKIHTTTTNSGDGGFGLVLINDISFTDSGGAGNTVGGLGFGTINDGKSNLEGASQSYGIYGFNINDTGGYSSSMSAVAGATQIQGGSYADFGNVIDGNFSMFGSSTVFGDVEVLSLTASKDAGSAIDGTLYGIKIDDMNLATTGNYAIYTGLGLIRFGDDVLAQKAIADNYDPNAIANFIGGSLPENMNQKIKINSVQVQKGTGTVSTSNYTITGVGTHFLTDAEVGDQIYVYDYNNYESYSAIITNIASDTTLSVALKFKVSRGGSEISGWDYGIQKPLFNVFHSEWTGDTTPLAVFGGNAIIQDGSFGNDGNDIDGGIVVGTPYGGNHILMNDIPGARYAITAGNYVFSIRSDASGKWEAIAYIDGGYLSSKKQLVVNGSVVVNSDTESLKLGADQDVLISSNANGVINIESANPTTTDITLNFGIGATNAGQYLWMEDEDYFKFSDDVLMNSTEKQYFRDTAIYLFSQADGYLNIVADSGVRLGDATPTNYTQFDADGDMTQVGTARIDWGKKTANSVTLTNGTSTDTVTDLQTMGDGNFYDVTEATGAPGINLIVDFISITAFNWVQIKGCYEGSDTHAVAVQLYNWNTTAWDTFDAMQNSYCDTSTSSGYILNSYDFFVPSDTNYIGTGGNAGKVRVRFYHTPSGNASHDMHLDVVALMQ